MSRRSVGSLYTTVWLLYASSGPNKFSAHLYSVFNQFLMSQVLTLHILMVLLFSGFVELNICGFSQKFEIPK